MNSPTTARLVRVALLLFLVLPVAPELLAHPEDDLCVPGENGMDPALCEALAAIDAADDTGRDIEPLLDESGQVRGFWSTLRLYVGIGVGHILPAGLDHILFVLALFLSSTSVRALVIQISTFTVAHTATLGLAAVGVIAPQASIVEPLIAATIAWVAVENLFFRDMPKWRPVIVFGFGLVHGMGFAGFFGELGLPAGQFWSALIGFNVGVEIGQLSVVAVAFLLGWLLRRYLADTHHEPSYRRYVVLPCSVAIGITGVWWAVSRLLG